MKNSHKILEKISSKCSDNITLYSYNENLPLSSKYKKGRVTSAQWINELCFYFLKKEQHLIAEFTLHLEKKTKELQNLNDCDYKNGLLEAIEEIKSHITNEK